MVCRLLFNFDTPTDLDIQFVPMRLFQPQHLNNPPVRPSCSPHRWGCHQRWRTRKLYIARPATTLRVNSQASAVLILQTPCFKGNKTTTKPASHVFDTLSFGFLALLLLGGVSPVTSQFNQNCSGAALPTSPTLPITNLLLFLHKSLTQPFRGSPGNLPKDSSFSSRP